MFRNKQLIDVVKLLDLKILIKDDNYYLLDVDNNPSIIQKLDEKYSSSFNKNGSSYFIEITEKNICISTDKNEKLSINKNSLSFEEKEDNGYYNKAYILFNDSFVSFYDNSTDDDLTTSLQIKISNDADYMEKSITLKNGGEFKEKIIVQDVDNVPIVNHKIRKYNNNGRLVTGSTFDEYLDYSVNEYINNEISNCELIKCSIDKLESILPGVINYFSNNSIILKSINKEKTI